MSRKKYLCTYFLWCKYQHMSALNQVPYLICNICTQCNRQNARMYFVHMCNSSDQIMFSCISKCISISQVKYMYTFQNIVHNHTLIQIWYTGQKYMIILLQSHPSYPDLKYPEFHFIQTTNHIPIFLCQNHPKSPVFMAIICAS